ncbi:WD40 repeat-like protein [Cryphonectria parasitica EP155]|uniref:WD40 repeat-like protein n=1 Tax=Cryphonectria parasitica (strain ATCC 38755 / EP155) TaxID=660469 RepID=A0A9P4YA12_CRYP1|nr:WD40 repeat-like protein [Cryphonectria parasitica EP155]KAF3769077.1 WD40 repeat-like protein [Cryphonectria parasitica EP155]
MATGVQIIHNQQIAHPAVIAVGTHANALGPDNYNLSSFIEAWQGAAWQGLPRERGRYPWPDRIDRQLSRSVMHIDYMDLEGDRYDVQGIDWEDLGVTRGEARERRLNTYKNYVNVPDSDRWEETQALLPSTDDYFRFRGLDVRRNINLAHFQLRNVLASTSRSSVFYPSQFAINEFNPITGKTKLGMRSQEIPHFQVSTLTAGHDTLVAGGFFGEYLFRRLSSEGSADTHEGTITSDNSGITNHVQIYASRTSSSPRAAFASNDNGFRVLDIETEKFVSETYFPNPVNCSAISPDRRLQVMVGDQRQVLITKAEADGEPEVLRTLDGHRDFGFACDWADDGWTVATGFQDKSVKIWDARRWTDAQGVPTPVCTLRSEVAGVRSLRFSPLGSGKRVLVAAEEADFVNIYDAQTFQSKQTFDFFGEIGGTSFVNEGQDLHVLCCDPNRGGLFRLERCGMGAERHHDPEDLGMRPYVACTDSSYDWQEFKVTPLRRPRYCETRRRRAITPHLLQPF